MTDGPIDIADYDGKNGVTKKERERYQQELIDNNYVQDENVGSDKYWKQQEGKGSGTTGFDQYVYITIPGFGNPVNGKPTDLAITSATTGKNLFVSLRESNDARLVAWKKSTGLGWADAQKLWNTTIDYAAKMSSGRSATGADGTVSFEEALNSKGLAEQVTGKRTGGPRKYVTYTDPAKARRDLNSEMRSYLGRDATEKEVKDYISKLSSAQSKNPSISSASGDTQVTRQSGFDEEDFLLRYVVAKTDFKKLKTGEARTALDKIKLLANDFGVLDNIAPSERRKLAKQYLLQKVDDAALYQKMADISKSAYPAFAGMLQPNETLRQALGNFVGTYAGLLEVDESDVNLKDVASKATMNINGEYKPLSLFEYEKVIRKDPKYQYTKRAHQEAADFGKAFARAMGVNL
jgi:hypothetical protein